MSSLVQDFPSVPFSARSRLRGVLAALALAGSALLFLPTVAAAHAPGQPDQAFGVHGDALFQFGAGAPASSRAEAVALQRNGKIVVGGSATDANGHPAALVARLTRHGALDSSFANHGSIVVQLASGRSDSFGPLSEVHALAIQPDGKILVGGTASRDNFEEIVVARLKPNGHPDRSFGDHGLVVLTSLGQPPTVLESAEVNALAVQPDGGILVAGDGFGELGPNVGFVARLKASNGQLDPSFGTGGSVFIFRPTSSGSHAIWSVNALALQPDGEIALAGVADNILGTQVLVARLSGTDGSLDSSFGDAGMVFFQPFPADGGREAAARGVALQSDGKIVFAGSAVGSDHPDERAVVGRLNGSDGSFDSSFAGSGTLVTQLGSGGASAFSRFYDVAIQPNGKIVLAGTATDSGGVHRYLLARLLGTGAFDPAFGTQGLVLRQFAQKGADGPSEAHALALQPNGKIVAAGFAGPKLVVTRTFGDPRHPH